MRQEPGFFEDDALELIYIAKRLKDALRLEDVFTQAGVDYVVETDTYRGGVVFVSERTGAFFYVDRAAAPSARAVMTGARFRPWEDG